MVYIKNRRHKTPNISPKSLSHPTLRARRLRIKQSNRLIGVKNGFSRCSSWKENDIFQDLKVEIPTAAKAINVFIGYSLSHS